jgi:hypothetical protein
MFTLTNKEVKVNEEDKYKVIYVFYVKAKSYSEAQDKAQDLRLEDADEKTVVKLRK